MLHAWRKLMSAPTARNSHDASKYIVTWLSVSRLPFQVPIDRWCENQFDRSDGSLGYHDSHGADASRHQAVNAPMRPAIPSERAFSEASIPFWCSARNVA